MYEDFQNKCAQLSNEQFQELLRQICVAVIDRDAIDTLKHQKIIIMMKQILTDYIISAWEICGGQIDIKLTLPGLEQSIEYQTGDKNDT